MRANWLGLISSVLILGSLFLPWLSATFYQIEGTFPSFRQDFSLNAGLSVHYFGIVAFANGITQLLLFPYWFNWVFCMVLLSAGLIAIKASFADRPMRRLMVLAGVLAIICSPLFYLAFASTLLSSPLRSSSLLFNIFSPGDFGLTTTDMPSLHTKSSLNFYWLSVAAGILAIVSTKWMPRRESLSK